jgi:hypothetical protein
MAAPDATLAQRIGEPAAAAVELAVGEPCGTVNDSELVGVGRGGALQQDERRERRKIRRVLGGVRCVVVVAGC